MVSPFLGQTAANWLQGKDRWFQHVTSHTFIITCSFINKEVTVLKVSSIACPDLSSHMCWVKARSPFCSPLGLSPHGDVSGLATCQGNISLFWPYVSHAAGNCHQLFPRNNPLHRSCLITGLSSMIPASCKIYLQDIQQLLLLPCYLHSSKQMQLLCDLGSKCNPESIYSNLCLSWKARHAWEERSIMWLLNLVHHQFHPQSAWEKFSIFLRIQHRVFSIVFFQSKIDLYDIHLLIHS